MNTYTVQMSYNFNIPVEFIIDSKKKLTEEQLIDMIRKDPSKFDTTFGSSAVNLEEKKFWDSMRDKKEWKTIMEEQLFVDDIIEDGF